MHEHHISTPRTARYLTLGDPGPAIREVWFVLHGYGQLAARFLRAFAPLDDGSRLIVAPEGLSRFYVDPAHRERVGSSWMTREDRLHEIADYVRYLDAVAAEVLEWVHPRTVRVHVLGFSQGTATACRWSALGTAHVHRLVLWGGEVPPDLDLGAARGRLAPLEPVLVAGSRDELITPKIRARDEERLRAAAIPFRVVSFDGGHELNDAVLRQLAG
ncbi:MAG: alpha/beta hydrolase [Gemmatimonadales bacterium]